MNDKITILVIDDEIVSRYTIEATLESEDYTLVSAENGKQALEKIEVIMPDLVLLDVMMPGMNGFEVCRRLRTYPHLANLPIIMVTAWDEPVARARCLEMGATEVICKPFNHNELNAIVSKFTQSHNNQNA
ncbi:MAG: hypothetical protein DRR19_10945 [Candidatus Parabeggiatoa sp. nov. 1]|nr:MAG: hypothetical protein DRR19_10945 [Gammaproteobacteria bacterium]